MKGLFNLGNTCYLNAALQCLVYVPPLTNYVLSGWAEKDLYRKRINACTLAAEYISLAKAYWGSKTPATLDPKALLTALTKLHKPFATPQPHDAHEALVLMLKYLHDAWVRTPRISPSYAYDDPRIDRAAWDAHLAGQGYSMVTELFQGQTECVVRGGDDADDGTYRSVTHEHFVGLSLDLNGCSTVTQAVNSQFGHIDIDGYTLPDGRVVTAKQTKRCTYMPLVLVLHLKRFDADGHKIDRFIDYTTSLDLGDLGSYELLSVAFHRDGHYTVACGVEGRWFLIDDTACTEINVNGVVSKDAYVLVYKKKCL